MNVHFSGMENYTITQLKQLVFNYIVFSVLLLIKFWKKKTYNHLKIYYNSAKKQQLFQKI